MTAQKIERKAFLILLLAFLILFSTACKTKESYKKEIERKGIVYSRESFLIEVKLENKENVELFIKAGMDVNAKDDYGFTALMNALTEGHTDVVNLLRKAGAKK